MKRVIPAILAAIAFLLTGLAAVVATPSPAQAYTCVTKSKVTSFNMYGPVIPDAGYWDGTFRMYYRVCDEPNGLHCDDRLCWYDNWTTTYVDKLTYVHDAVASPKCGSIDYWGVNPNALGGTWDPVQRTGGCSSSVTKTFDWDPAPVRITQDMSNAEKCVAITVREYPGGYSGDTKVSDSLCVTFTL